MTPGTAHPAQAWALKAWRWLGWPGALALALSLAAAAAAVGLPRQQARLDAERSALAEQRLALKRQTQRATAPTGPAALRADLPPDSERQARTAALLALSTESGLPWPRSEFRYQADRELGLAQYRVNMSLAGPYSALRRYVAEALRRDHALALDSVRLKREAGGRVTAELAWVLHMQSGERP